MVRSIKTSILLFYCWVVSGRIMCENKAEILVSVIVCCVEKQIYY